jgi:uncharacterized protein YyaL (SSP411 family)
MLYDNAQLARVYLHAWQLTGNPFYRAITEETLDYVAREMRGPEGGFYSTQDADSEGDEAQIERAVELYALASRYPFVANSRWFGDVAGSQITALAASLPEAAAVTASRERGQARDLEATVEELLSELRA